MSIIRSRKIGRFTVVELSEDDGLGSIPTTPTAPTAPAPGPAPAPAPAPAPPIAFFNYLNTPVHVDVGGTEFTSSLFTLTSYPDSTLSKMFDGTKPIVHDVMKNNYFIDRDGGMFQHILNFMRNKKLLLPLDFEHCDLLLAEAEYFNLNEMVKEIKKLKITQEGIGYGLRQLVLEAESNHEMLMEETERLKRETETLREHEQVVQRTGL